MLAKQYFLVIILLALSPRLVNIAKAADSCELANSESITVVINPNLSIASKKNASSFGFTVDWFQFQNGFFRHGKVRQEVVDWLKPFKGALYRYSGGNTFEWKKAIGPISKRKSIYANYQGLAHPEFGPSEFFDLMKKVEGKAVILLNVTDNKNGGKNNSAMTNDNINYLEWLSTNEPGCVGGSNCPIYYFELGNEVDWEKQLKWSASQYTERVLPLIKDAKAKFPLIKFAVVGKTAPWDGEVDSEGRKFDTEVSANLASHIDAVTIHPYYDGYPVPVMESYINKLAKTYKLHNPTVRILVTEHGRWPSMPIVGNWEKNWYLASGSGGAISTADFTLMSMANPNIEGAMWHTISARGPWQLFHLNNKDDSVYPSAVYWSLRTLQEGFLEDIVEVTPALVKGTSYKGGYDMRLVAMQNKLGQISLMGVNRNAGVKALNIKIKNVNFDRAKTSISTMQADVVGTDNTEENQNKFQMRTSFGNYSSITPSLICIPPRSTFSIVVGVK